MKFLFIVGDISIKNDANINIAKIVSKQMITLGHEVFYVGMTSDSDYKWSQEDDYKEVNYVVNYGLEHYGLHHYISTFSLKRIFPSVLEKINKYLSILQKKKDISNALQSNIETICNENLIDCCIAFSSPIITSMALAKSNIRSVKAMYQLDPYFSHYLNTSKFRKLKMLINEAHIYRNINLSFLTDLIYKDNLNNNLRKYIKKMYPIEFPNVRRISKVRNKIEFDERKINCVYVGNIYNDIRNPEWLLQLFSQFERNDIVLHFIGGGEVDILNSFRDTLGDRLRVHGIVDNVDATDAMLNANILVNIGNTIINQMPSKIFDYISSCKPIINFCKIENCPTIKYMNMYPISLNVFEHHGITFEIINEVERFCVENKDLQIDFNQIEEIFACNTVSHVTSEIANVVKKSLQNSI